MQALILKHPLEQMFKIVQIQECRYLRKAALIHNILEIDSYSQYWLYLYFCAFCFQIKNMDI